MNTQFDASLAWPRWFRAALVAVSTLILCSCRASGPVQSPVAANPAIQQGTLAVGTPRSQPGPSHEAYPVQQASYVTDYADVEVAPQEAATIGFGEQHYSGEYAGTYAGHGCAACYGGGDGYAEGGQWRPPGIAGPWPANEYLCDGGDELPPVEVGRDWRVHGLDSEDTIVHFDTNRGGTEVEATNRVCLYAPRFGAVRQVTNFEQFASIDQPGRVHLPLQAGAEGRLLPPTVALQQDQPVADIAIKQMTTLREQQPLAIAIRDLKAAEFAKGFLAFEDFAIIRWGQYDNTEKARLAEKIDAAIAWTADQAVQVVIENVEAGVVNGDVKAQATFQVDAPGKGKLRVVKVASTGDAKPGETVEFTIRYDNVGESDIGNVTVVDNLTTRLEFVPGSNQTNRPAAFSTENNEHGSLVLRWEITDPIKPGEGGIVRFKTRVR